MSCNFEGTNIVDVEKILAIEAKYIIQNILCKNKRAMARACKWRYKDIIFYKEDCDRPTVRDVILTPTILC